MSGVQHARYGSVSVLRSPAGRPGQLSVGGTARTYGTRGWAASQDRVCADQVLSEGVVQLGAVGERTRQSTDSDPSRRSSPDR